MPKVTVVVPVGAAELPVFLRRNLPDVLVLTDQPEASPRLVGCEDRVELALEKPDGIEQEPEAVVQITASADCKTVAEGSVIVRV